MTPFDANGAFLPAQHDGAVRRLAVQGAGVTVFSGVLGLGIQIAATMVLARLLTPEDFGLVTMVTTFSLLLVSFGLNGFTEAVIQRKEIDHGLASNLFWINLGGGLLLTIAFAVGGTLMARFYHNPHVTRLAIGMSPTILISSVSVMHLGLLKRAMRYSVISANEIVARIASIAVSIVLAWAGWGYWALVAGAIAQGLATSVGAWSLCQWVPGLPQRATGTADMVRFALNVYGRFSINYSARNADNLLVGWRFSAQSLGFYKKAYDLFALSASQLVAPLTVVAVSALSRLSQDSAEYKRYFLSTLGVMAFIGMGLGANLTLIGTDAIRLLLGPGWEPAGRIFTFFGPGIGIMLVYGTHGWIHLSIGTADRWFRWGVIECLVTGLLFILGLHWGPVGIAAAWTVSFWILTIPAFWYAGRPIQLGVARVVAAVWRFLLASLLAGCTAGVIARGPALFVAAGSVGAAVRIMTVSLLFAVLYLGAVVLLHQGWAPILQVAGLLRDMVPWGNHSRPYLRADATSNM